MRVYKEAEATGYLERLNKTVENYNFIDEPPFPNLKAVLSIELSYFRRLMRDPAKKELAVLGVSPSGFPELPSLALDVQKAYEELDVIEAEVGKSVYPLFQRLNLEKNIEAYKGGVTRVLEDFEQDQEHIRLLKTTQTQAQGLSIQKLIPEPLNDDTGFRQYQQNWGASVYTRPGREGLLFYDRCVYSSEWNQTSFRGNKLSEWKYLTGFFKYIDLPESGPLLITSGQKVTSDRQKITYKENATTLASFPEKNKLFSLLEPLNQNTREMILSVDFTDFSDEDFRGFIEYSSKMGLLLQHVDIKPENLQIESTFALPLKGWRRLLPGSKNE